MARKPISKSRRFDVLSRDKFMCRYCGASADDGVVLHVDHVQPVAAGGGDDLDNLVSACQDCNLGKGAKLLEIGEKKQKTWGLSFDDRGRVKWQFIVNSATDHCANITTFSWVSGEPWSDENVSSEFLKTRCLLFPTKDLFAESVDFWSDPRKERVNPDFVAGGA